MNFLLWKKLENRLDQQSPKRIQHTWISEKHDLLQHSLWSIRNMEGKTDKYSVPMWRNGKKEKKNANKREYYRNNQEKLAEKAIGRSGYKKIISYTVQQV